MNHLGDDFDPDPDPPGDGAELVWTLAAAVAAVAFVAVLAAAVFSPG